MLHEKMLRKKCSGEEMLPRKNAPAKKCSREKMLREKMLPLGIGTRVYNMLNLHLVKLYTYHLTQAKMA